MIGVDEVGRGAWAGPLLVVAARPKKGKKLPKGLTDSKLLTKKQREKLYPKILDSCDIGEGWVASDVIDSIGLSAAMKSACLLAVLKINARANENILLDGTVDYYKDTHYSNVKTKPKADLSDPVVSCAAIVAKVQRDTLMADFDEDYPGFGFKENVGYGTVEHKKAITKNGITLIHRKSYKPIKDLGW